MTQVTPCKNGFLECTEEFLLCDEVWDMSPDPSSCSPNDHTQGDDHNINNSHNSIHHPIMTKHDFKHSFDTYLEKEIKFLTRPEYINHLQMNAFVVDCRSKAIRWFHHCQRRFNLCIGNVFKALNYVDRFIEMHKCHGWSYWMMELLSLASFSIAIKFSETCPPSLREIQEGLEYSFDAKLIQKMEMKILKSLGWEVNSITPYSYVELFGSELNQHFTPFVRSRLDEIFLESSFDVQMLKFRPCVIAMSGLRCILEDEGCISHILSFIPKDQEDNIQSCYNIMQEILAGHQKSISNWDPSSPDTVLTKELQVAINEEQIDLSFIDEPATKDNLIKRKRVVDDDDCDIKYKKYVN